MRVPTTASIQPYPIAWRRERALERGKVKIIQKFLVSSLVMLGITATLGVATASASEGNPVPPIGDSQAVVMAAGGGAYTDPFTESVCAVEPTAPRNIAWTVHRTVGSYVVTTDDPTYDATQYFLEEFNQPFQVKYPQGYPTFIPGKATFSIKTDNRALLRQVSVCIGISHWAPVLDENGNPVLNEYGLEVWVEVVDAAQWVTVRNSRTATFTIPGYDYVTGQSARVVSYVVWGARDGRLTGPR